MKTNIMVWVLVAIVAMVSLSAAQQKDTALPAKTDAAQNTGAKELIIPNSKGDVKLPHYAHQEALKDCNVCHSLFPQKAGSIAELKAQSKLEKKQVMNTQCIKCHKEKKEAGQKSGPTSCSECHK